MAKPQQQGELLPTVYAVVFTLDIWRRSENGPLEQGGLTRDFTKENSSFFLSNLVRIFKATN